MGIIHRRNPTANHYKSPSLSLAAAQVALLFTCTYPTPTPPVATPPPTITAWDLHYYLQYDGNGSGGVCGVLTGKSPTLRGPTCQCVLGLVLMVMSEVGNSYSYQESSRSQLPILSFFLSSCHHCMIHQFCSLVLQTRTATEQFKSEMRHIYSVSTVYLQCISSADREAGWMEFCVVTSSYVTPCSLSHPACAWLTARWWNCSRSKVTHCNSIFIVVMLSRLSDQYQLLWCIEIWHILLLSGKLWPQHFPRLSRFSRASGNLLVVGDV